MWGKIPIDLRDLTKYVVNDTTGMYSWCNAPTQAMEIARTIQHIPEVTVSFDGIFPDGPFYIPTRDDLERIVSFDTLGQVPYHELPVGSYYILGGAFHYKSEDLKDPIRKPDIGDVETVENFATDGLAPIASRMAFIHVIHIKPTKWNGPSPTELAGMSRRDKNQWLNKMRGTDGTPEPTPKYIKRPRRRR